MRNVIIKIIKQRVTRKRYYFRWGARESLFGKVTFQLSSKSIPDRWKSKCKVPQSDTNFRNRNKAKMAGAWKEGGSWLDVNSGKAGAGSY